MRILIACEFSGVVRRAFAARRHQVYSCDLLPSDDGDSAHIQSPLEKVLPRLHALCPLDMLIHHTPCTYATNAGARWLYIGGRGTVPDENRWQKMREGAALFRYCQEADIPKIVGENPIPHRHALALMGPYSQIIQPWQFGHGETKATCLWLKGVPPLVPTNIVAGREPRVHHASPGPDRWKERSRTLPGIAEAMAAQWS